MHLMSTFWFSTSIPLKRGIPLFTEAGTYCMEEQAVEIWPIKSSGLCYGNVGLPGTKTVVQLCLFQLVFFKHSPMASREDCNWNFWTEPLTPLPLTKNKRADYATMLSINVQKAKNCNFLMPVLMPPWFSPESVKSNWLKIAKQEILLMVRGLGGGMYSSSLA